MWPATTHLHARSGARGERDRWAGRSIEAHRPSAGSIRPSRGGRPRIVGYDAGMHSSRVAGLPLAVTDPAALIETIRASVIGDDEAVAGPFGTRRVTYADYTASGRSLTFIEDYIREAVLPLYANTHTESSGTGLQTTRFREEAREIIRAAVGASDGPRRHLHRRRLDLRGQQARGGPRPAPPGRAGRALRAERADPRRPSGRSCSSARSSITATSCRGANRSPTSWSSTRTPTGTSTRRISPPSWHATRTGHCRIGSFSAASNVTGIVSDTYGDRPPPPRARRAVVLGPGRRRAVRRDRDGPAGRSARLQGRDLHLAPQVHRWAGHAGPPRRPPGAVHEPRPDGARRRHRRLRQPGRARLPRRHRASRGRRHAGHRGVDPGRARLRPQVGGGGGGDPVARALVHRPGDRPLGRPSGHRDPGQPVGGAAVDRLVRHPPRRPLPPPQLRRGRCSATCSGSSRGAAAPAPGRTAIASWASTSRRRTSSSARSRAAARASSPAGSGSTSTTSSARPCSSTSSPRSSSWRPTAGGSCPSTASMPRPGCGGTPVRAWSRRSPWRT